MYKKLQYVQMYCMYLCLFKVSDNNAWGGPQQTADPAADGWDVQPPGPDRLLSPLLHQSRVSEHAHSLTQRHRVSGAF